MPSRPSPKSRSVPKPASPLAELALPLVLGVILVAGIGLIIWGVSRG